jgi:hypothetical protein
MTRTRGLRQIRAYISGRNHHPDSGSSPRNTKALPPLYLPILLAPGYDFVIPFSHGVQEWSARLTRPGSETLDPFARHLFLCCEGRYPGHANRMAFIESSSPCWYDPFCACTQLHSTGTLLGQPDFPWAPPSRAEPVKVSARRVENICDAISPDGLDLGGSRSGCPVRELSSFTFARCHGCLATHGHVLLSRQVLTSLRHAIAQA